LKSRGGKLHVFNEEQTMKTMQSPICWCVVVVFWVLGAFLLLKIWNYQIGCFGFRIPEKVFFYKNLN
jgi:hypothetical protein